MGESRRNLALSGPDRGGGDPSRNATDGAPFQLTHRRPVIYFRVPSLKDQAVCIRQWDWSETSQTVSLFSRAAGVIRAVAKGARREKGSFSGGLEVMTRGEMVAIIRNPENSGDAMATLTSWDLQEIFPRARRALAAFHAGMYMLDLVHHTVRAADPHPGLFDDLLTGLRALEIPDAEDRAVLTFQWAVLVHTGFAPQLFRDVRTGLHLGSQPAYGFVPEQGGLIADVSGSQSSPGAPAGAAVWGVRAETVDLLRRLLVGQQSTDPGGTLADTASGPGVVARANRLLAWYLRSIVGAWPDAVHGALPGIAQMEPRAQ